SRLLLMLRSHPDYAAGDSNGRTNREIDPAADNDHGHAYRTDCHNHSLCKDDPEIGYREIARWRTGKQRKCQHYQRQAGKRGKTANIHAPPTPPIAASSTESAVHSLTGRAGDNPPPNITPTLSH